jgi:hypothetical protein
VLMAVINNWDLKDSNNSIYQVKGSSPEERYIITDLGASFGTMGFNNSTKGKLRDYQRSRWLGKVSAESVNFNVPGPPAAPIFFNLPEFSLRMRLLWLGRNIPIADARWIGGLLGQLSPQQIRNAFRAAGYSPEDVDSYAQVVERRINELKGL